MNEVFEKIKSITAEQTGYDAAKITQETSFQGDIQADSLDLFQIINDIEDAYDIKIENAEEIKTVADAVKFVEDHR